MWGFRRAPFVAPILLSLIGFSPLTGTAQDFRLMKAGDLVRIRIVESLPYSDSIEGPQVSAGSLLIGKVRSVSDVVVLRGIEGREWEIPASSIEAAEALIGLKKNTLQGLSLGVFIGGSVGVSIGLLAGDDPPSCWIMCLSRGEKAAIAGSALGVIGGIFGLFAGALTESEIWEDVGVSVLKASFQKGRGFGVGISLPLRKW